MSRDLAVSSITFACAVLLAGYLGVRENGASSGESPAERLSSEVHRSIDDRELRPTSGRLYGAGRHRPFVAGDRSVADRIFHRDADDVARWGDLRRRANELEAGVERDRMVALLQLGVPGGIDDAISGLREVRAALGEQTARRSLAASIHNDLAVLYLTRAEEDRPLDLLEALRHADRAYRLEPAHPAVAFNRAQALSRLYLSRMAHDAWEEYLSLEEDVGWNEEAETWMAGLRPELPHDLSAVLLGATPLDAELTELARRHPYEARVAVEEDLLHAWVEQAPRRSRLVRRAWRYASVLEDRGGYLAADVLLCLEEADGKSLDGLTAYSRGIRAYRAGDHAAAEPELQRAEQLLDGSCRPLAQLADLYRTVGIYFRDTKSAEVLFHAQLARIDETRHPSLEARVHWMLAIIGLTQGRHAYGLEHARRMGTLLELTSGVVRARIADGIMAEIYEARGEIERSWHHRLLALESQLGGKDLVRRHQFLHESTQALVRRGVPDVAVIFAEETLHNARRLGRSWALAEAWSERGRALSRAGRGTEARRSAREAIEAAGSIVDGSALKKRTEAMARITLGLTLAESEPEEAQREMQSAHEILAGQSWYVERQRYLLASAEVNRRLGNLDAARNSLELSVQEIEGWSREAKATMSSIEIQHHTQVAFEGLIALALDSEAGPAAAERSFRVTERSRVRELARRRGLDDGVDVDLRSLRRTLDDENAALVAWAVLPDRLSAWVVAGDDVEYRETALDRDALETRVDLLLEAFERDDREAADRLSADLYDLLLVPTRDAWGGVSKLVLVPDLFLERLPFAALRERSSGRYLIEDVEVSTAPSASLWLDSATRRGGGPPLSLLAVAVAEAGQGLPPLPWAEREIDRIVGLYPRSMAISAAGDRRFDPSDLAAGQQVFHFAGHALAGRSREVARLVLWPASEPRDISAERILESSLEGTKLVVLGACRGADGRAWGREGVASLRNAFLGAGAGAVLAALWEVDDRAGMEFLVRFHESFRGDGDAARALRETVLESLEDPDEDLRDPRVWATFTLTGA